MHGVAERWKEAGADGGRHFRGARRRAEECRRSQPRLRVLASCVPATGDFPRFVDPGPSFGGWLGVVPGEVSQYLLSGGGDGCVWLGVRLCRIPAIRFRPAVSACCVWREPRSARGRPLSPVARRVGVR